MALLEQIRNIESEFAFYGFIYPPLNRKRIASLLIRGFNSEQIYNLGCDSYCIKSLNKRINK